MLACYAPDVRFSDPVFPDLDAAGVAAMWRMLASRGKDLEVVASGIAADGETGRAHWVATYTYSATGRPVENRIDAALRSAMAASSGTRIASICTAGRGRRSDRRALLLGWLPPVQDAIRRQAAATLAAWQAKNPPGSPPAR